MNIFHAEKVHNAVVKTTKATAIASAVLVSSNAIAQDDLAIEEEPISSLPMFKTKYRAHDNPFPLKRISLEIE